MEITYIKEKEFFEFYKLVYKNDVKFIDNKTEIFKIVCNKNKHFYKNSKQKIIGVKNEGKLKCACVLILHNNYKETLMISFFEALENAHKEVEHLLKYSEKMAKKNGCKKITLGIDGNINNSMAFPIKEKAPSFGENYCKEYYHNYFVGFEKVKFVSYYESMENINNQLKKDLPKLEKYKNDIEFEFGNLRKNFKGTMKKYCKLNDEIFYDHKYFYKRGIEEEMDLFKGFKFLLFPEHLVFVKFKGEYAGFMLWYPDFNELVKTGKAFGVLELIKYRVFKIIPKKVKVVEIGVKKEFRKYGIIASLLNFTFYKADKKTETLISSWILDENINSKLITQRYVKKDYKDFYVYEKHI